MKISFDNSIFFLQILISSVLGIVGTGRKQNEIKKKRFYFWTIQDTSTFTFFFSIQKF